MSKELTVIEQRPSVNRAIERAPLADSTKVKYRRAIERYQDTGRDLFNAGDLAEYAQGLSQSGRAFLKSAIRLVVTQMKAEMDARADPLAPNVVELDARMGQADRVFNTILDTIKVKESEGTKVHTWLTQSEVKRLLDTCGDDLSGRRDHIALALCVAAGLRRAEAVALCFSDVKLQPVKDRLRTVLQIVGKGAKSRVVPVSDALANALDEWAALAGISEGPILRSVGKGGELGDSLSGVGLFHIVRARGAEIGKAELAPHDLRRTFAQLGFEAGVAITQISTLLGHSNVATTQRYLNLALDLDTTVSDFIPV